MPVESWITPDDTPVFAAQAAAHIDTTLARLAEAERTAFWASVRKCYNTPYNDPKPRALPAPVVVAQALAEAPERPTPDLDRPSLELGEIAPPDLADLDLPGLAMPVVAMPVAAMQGPGAEAHVS